MLTGTALREAKRALAEKLLGGGLAPGLPEPSSISTPALEASVPLSYNQEQIYRHARFASRLSPDSLLYNESVTIHRKGPLDIAALQRSLTEIVRRHEAWRTTFQDSGGTAVQVVHPASPVPLPVVDLRSLPPPVDRQSAALLWATDDLRRPFDLARGPLVRFSLVQLADAEYRLFLAAHQIVLDGVSVYNVFLPELIAIYEAYCAGDPSPLPELAVQCADFSVRQRRSETNLLALELDYWRRQFREFPALLRLPTDHPRPCLQSFKGAIEPFGLPEETARHLRQFSLDQGVTLFVTMLAGFSVLLHRYTAQDHVRLGTLAPTRNNSSVHKLLGYFLNPVTLHIDLSGAPSFLDIVRRTRDTVLGALSHSGVPFHLLQEHLDPAPDPSRNPFYQVQFSQEPPMLRLSAGWDLTPMDVESGGSKLDLYLVVDDRPEGILGRVQYNPDLFERTTVRRMVHQYHTILQASLSTPQQPVAQLPSFSMCG